MVEAAAPRGDGVRLQELIAETDALNARLARAIQVFERPLDASPPPPDPFVDHAFKKMAELAGHLGWCTGSIKIAIDYLEAIDESDRTVFTDSTLRVLRRALVECGEGR